MISLLKHLAGRRKISSGGGARGDPVKFVVSPQVFRGNAGSQTEILGSFGQFAVTELDLCLLVEFVKASERLLLADLLWRTVGGECAGQEYRRADESHTRARVILSGQTVVKSPV